MKKSCLIRASLRTPVQKQLCELLWDYNVKLACEENLKGIDSTNIFSDEDLAYADIIIGNPSINSLAKCENLKWLQLVSSGADNYVNSGLINPSKTILTNATGAYGHAIAEYMVAAVFAMTKKLHLYRDNQFDGNWIDLGKVKTIRSSKVLVVGFGDIGSQFAERMNLLGAEIYGIKRTLSQKPSYVKEMYTIDRLNEILGEMDIVALCLPNSASTQNTMGKRQFELMKNDGILINVGRGNAVDTAALNDALDQKQIGGAILDVVNPEPLPSYNPLWKQKNVMITPHISGGYHSIETIETLEKIVLENVKRYVNGLPLENSVDFTTGYKKH